jgi:hypothetical protein
MAISHARLIFKSVALRFLAAIAPASGLAIAFCEISLRPWSTVCYIQCCQSVVGNLLDIHVERLWHWLRLETLADWVSTWANQLERQR